MQFHISVTIHYQKSSKEVILRSDNRSLSKEEKAIEADEEEFVHPLSSFVCTT